MKPEQSRDVILERALAAHQRGDFAAAEQDYRKVLASVPAQPVATHFLGLLLHQRDRDSESLPLLGRSLELDPANAVYYQNVASVFKQLGRATDAETHYRKALALKPDYLDAWLNLGELYGSRGDHAQALACYEQARRLDPASFAASLNGGYAFYELAREAEALDSYRRAAELAGDDAAKLQATAAAWREAGELQEANGCLQRAVQATPADPQAHDAYGSVLGMQGELQEAENQYREALRLKPDYAGAYHNLVGVTRLSPQDATWPGLMTLAERVDALSQGDAIFTHFTLGRVWDALGDYDRAFGHFLRGNALKRAGLNYDEAGQARFFRDFIRLFDGEYLQAHQGAGIVDERPVFVVGMSRSGTTLVEQILASHPSVHGAGEINTLRNCLRLELPPGASDYRIPGQLAVLPVAALRRIAERYAGCLDRYSQGVDRVTNKLPGNMALVGLIHVLFPKARIVHVRRDPLDTCLSCFTMLFTQGHAFSYDLGELGRFYRMYATLMEDWRRILPPGRMLEVRYEELVADLEPQARRLVDYCGLDWNPACLDFHSQRRGVKTASLAQVRRPLYTSSVGRWRHYEQHLGPLKEALGL